MAAASIAPLVPLPAGAAAPMAKIAPNFGPLSYIWGAHYARLKGDCSADILAGRFDLAPEVAHEINRRLIKNGVISVPNALGISQARNPHLSSIRTTGQMVTKVKPKPSSGDLTQKMHRKLDEFVDEQIDEAALEDENLSPADTDQTTQDL